MMWRFIKTMMQRRLNSKQGFTLIELMVVIVILGLLAGIVAPKIINYIGEGERTQAESNIKSLETALNMYRLDSGIYPDTEQGLQALVEAPSTGTLPRKWRKGGYIEKIPKDPWGNDYIYICPGAHGDFDLMSYGKDGMSGGEDDNADINNWEIE